MRTGQLPTFPYGAVYFRKSNPPRDDWERDYQTASEDGMNAFRHWFMWSAVEVRPGVYDWSDYDRQLDLAAKYGIKTIIAEMITAAPEWTYREYAHARLITRDGRAIRSQIGGSSATGGYPGLCLDNQDYREAAEAFLRALVTRYRSHPGLGGYDVWNECNYGSDTCYCPATVTAFHAWLQRKYGGLERLAEAWHRYSLADWQDVEPPRAIEPYPEALDWLEFRMDNAYALMRWRVDLIRNLDPDHPITAHGVAGSLTNMAPRGADDWRAAAEVELYGYTWSSARHGDEPWKQFRTVDLVRASCRGKPFWHAEAHMGDLWMQQQVVGRPRNEGRMAKPEDVRYWNLASAAGGATGVFCPRWRPLLDGPLFGAMGPYGMDGSRTERSAMAGAVARWANAQEQEALWKSRPIQGEIGILYVPETQIFDYAFHGISTGRLADPGPVSYYAQSTHGVYQGFFDRNIQADWVHIDDIDDYRVLYLPYPLMMSQRSAEALRRWVHSGGVLISEGCPGYFGDGGHVGTTQPSLGLDELFGARQSHVEFTPDLLANTKVAMNGTSAWAGLYLQAYEPAGGQPVAWYEDGQVAVVDNNYGRGRTRLIGTVIGAGYYAHVDGRSSQVFADLLEFAGTEQHVRSSDPRVKARIHDGEGGTYLYVANPTRHCRPVRLELGLRWRGLSPARALWGAEASRDGDDIVLTAGARDVTVIALAKQ